MLKQCYLLSFIFVILSNYIFSQQESDWKTKSFNNVFSHKDSLNILAEKDRYTPDNWEIALDRQNGDSILKCYYPNGMLKKSVMYHHDSTCFVEVKYSNGQLKSKGYVTTFDTSSQWLPCFLYSSEVNFIYDYEGDYDWVFYKYLDSKNKIYYVDGDYVYGSLFAIWIRSDSVYYNNPICEFQVKECKKGWKITVFSFDSEERKRNEHSDRAFLKSFYSKVYPQIRLKFHTTYHFYIKKGLIRCQNVYVIKL